MALNEMKSFDSAAQAKRNLRAAFEKLRLGLEIRRRSAENAMCTLTF